MSLANASHEHKPCTLINSSHTKYIEFILWGDQKVPSLVTSTTSCKPGIVMKKHHSWPEAGNRQNMQ